MSVDLELYKWIASEGLSVFLLLFFVIRLNKTLERNGQILVKILERLAIQSETNHGDGESWESVSLRSKLLSHVFLIFIGTEASRFQCNLHPLEGHLSWPPVRQAYRSARCPGGQHGLLPIRNRHRACHTVL